MHLYVCTYVTISISHIPIVPLLCTHVYACAKVHGYLRTRCAHGYRYVCAPRMHGCVYHAHAGVCACNAWRLPSAYSAPRLSIFPGRSITATKVKALPEWLGRCKLLEILCVLHRRLECSRRCRRCAAARGAVAPGAALRHAALYAAAAALPVVVRGRAPRAHALRPRPTGARERWAGAARRGRTVGAQARARHRAHGAAGGGRVAEPGDFVSAPAAALTRPRRRAEAWRAGH